MARLLPAGGSLEPFEGAQVHGFLSQGYILTSGNQLFGDSRHGGSSITRNWA
ncbi:hypothetical protein [Methylogaea oryzae]|uniref:hypothetical protein n=1 Tax=Methylogaea oryzae TaxID=1295382 RepID=UPI0012E1C8B6|nr:hypothetical protein [Methylogaea oryzae]